jgi:hypothetical protein
MQKITGADDMDSVHAAHFDGTDRRTSSPVASRSDLRANGIAGVFPNLKNVAGSSRKSASLKIPV